MSVYIGTKLKFLRERSGETQEEVAAVVGVGRSYVKAWECDERPVSKIDHLKKLAEHFDVPSDYLLGLLPNADATNADVHCIVSEYTGLKNDAIQAIKAHGTLARELNEVLNRESFYAVIETLKDLLQAYEECAKAKGDLSSIPNYKPKAEAIEKLALSYSELRIQRFEMHERWSDFTDSFLDEVGVQELIAECKRLLRPRGYKT